MKTFFVVLSLIFVSCSTPKDTTLVDQFVFGETMIRKSYLEKAFVDWKIRGQVELVKENKGENGVYVVFTDSCLEDFLGPSRVSCVRNFSIIEMKAYCLFRRNLSHSIVIRRPFFQNTDEAGKRLTIAHEMGHCLGLGHTNAPEDVMYEFFQPTYNPPNDAEIALRKQTSPDGTLVKFYLYPGY